MEYLPKDHIDYKKLPTIIYDYSYLEKLKEKTNKHKPKSKHRLFDQKM